MADEERAPENPDQDPPTVTTMEEAVAVIRSIAKICRGRLGSLQAPSDATEEERAAVESDLRSRITAALKEGNEMVAKALDTDTRRPCGYDVNELIEAGPFDGQDHEVECPRCGVKISYRAPVFPEMAAPEAP